MLWPLLIMAVGEVPVHDAAHTMSIRNEILRRRLGWLTHLAVASGDTPRGSSFEPARDPLDLHHRLHAVAGVAVIGATLAIMLDYRRLRARSKGSARRSRSARTRPNLATNFVLHCDAGGTANKPATDPDIVEACERQFAACEHGRAFHPRLCRLFGKVSTGHDPRFGRRVFAWLLDTLWPTSCPALLRGLNILVRTGKAPALARFYRLAKAPATTI